MKNRTEEYWALVSELSRPPEELAGSVERARKRAKRAAPLRRLAAPAASLAAIAATFVLLVNVSVPFALACSGVPIVRELAAAVAFSPSLSAAVEHDYVQYIGQSQTVDGVTVNLEYAIVDPVQAVFFYSVDGGRFYTSPRLYDENGQPIGGYGTDCSYAGGETQDGLDSMTLSFVGGGPGLPDRFTMEMFFLPLEKDVIHENEAQTEAPSASVWDEPPESVNPREDPNTAHIFFDITLDPARSAGKTVEVGQWLDLDGQRILVDKLELYPTRTVLRLGEDEHNTAWLRSLSFTFTDARGRVYDDIDGSLSASGEPEDESKSYLTYYFQSFYYSQPEELTLHITRARWLEKDRDHVVLDLTTGDCPGLPEDVTVGEITRSGSGVEVTLHTPLDTDGQTLLGTYWDPEGGEHSINQWGFRDVYDEDTGEKTGSRESIYLRDYPWDTVELELNYTSLTTYEEPVQVAVG